MCEIKETIYREKKCNISTYGYLGVFIHYFHFIINYNLSIHIFFYFIFENAISSKKYKA